MKSAMGISSLTSGFTIWSSNGCDCLLSSIAVISEMSLSGSSRTHGNHISLPGEGESPL